MAGGNCAWVAVAGRCRPVSTTPHSDTKRYLECLKNRCFVHFRRTTLDLPQHTLLPSKESAMKTVITTALSLSLLVSGMAIAAPAVGPQQRPEAGPARTPAPAPATPAKKAAPVTAPRSHAASAPKVAAKAPATTPQHRAHRKGERLQANHRGVRVTDLRGKGLRAPGRGQEWRLLEGKYLLITSATGLINDIITARR